MSNVTVIGEQAKLVALLESALAEARAGHLVSCAIVEVFDDGAVGSGVFSAEGRGHLYALIGAIEVVKVEAMRRVEGLL